VEDKVIHYHGTPITPVSVLLTLAGKHFCVSHARPDDVRRVHSIAQSVMLDNGAFSAWKSNKQTNWEAYYKWTDRWLDYPANWAVIPDVIDAGSQEQDALVAQWPHGTRGAPVYHMDEPISRLLMLCETWPRVCVGSTAEFATVLSATWCSRMDDIFNQLNATFLKIPVLHMLRGMQLSGMHYPFASVDSTDVAQNHNRPNNFARQMADRWDAAQTPGTWLHKPLQQFLL